MSLIEALKGMFGSYKPDSYPSNREDYFPRESDPHASLVSANDIPIAHTPAGGYKEFPPPILAGCTEPISYGIPDIRGVWQVYKGVMKGHIQRIEQCGNRIVITGFNVIHDMRADGTIANGIHDVSKKGKTIIRIVEVIDDRLEMRHQDGTVLESLWLERDKLIYKVGPSINKMRRIYGPPKR